jgi:peptidoglycan/LPS O-acetylase OafA/YrhL
VRLETSSAVTVDRDVPHVAASSAVSSYRPYLDGIRMVAVYLVVAFHAGLGVFNGGFIGVDLFFVLSGYLVTSILLRDLVAGGRVQWLQFYSRRVRRIFPAAMVTLVLTALAFSLIASPGELLDALGGFRAAFLYVSNWYFIRQSTDYFAPNVATNPVLQFWSLSVEEQFYLLWPLALSGLYIAARRAGRHRWWVLRVAVVGVGLLSAVTAIRLASTDIERAYYGTDTRVYQLFAGAFLALTPQAVSMLRRRRVVTRVLSAIALLAIIVLATSIIELGPVTRGLLAVIAATTLVATLEAVPRGRVGRLMSRRSITYLGRISYGTYLWHWPVIVLLTHDRSIAPVPLFLIVCATATAIAALSFRILEHPIRVSSALNRMRAPVVAVGIGCSLILGLIFMPLLFDSHSGAVAATATAGGGPKQLDWRVARKEIAPLPDCTAVSVTKCTVVKGRGPRVVLMGDSAARMWVPAFTEVARRESLNFSILAFPGCPWEQSLEYNLSDRAISLCEQHKRDWYTRAISALRPDIIFLAQRAYDDPANSVRFYLGQGHVIGTDSPDFESTVSSASVESLNALSAPHRKIVVIEPSPIAPTAVNPLDCLSTGSKAADCDFRTYAGLTPFERFLRRESADGLIETIDLDRLLCPHAPTCDTIVNNIIVWRDEAHITTSYSKSLSPALDALLRRRKLLAP